GYTILGDRRAAVFLVENYVASLRTQRNFHCVGELIDAAQNCRARFFAMSYLFCHNLFLLLQSLTNVPFCLTREAGVSIKSGAQAPGRPKLSGARIRGRKRTGLNGWDFHTFYLTPFHGLTAF